ncbi:mitochondrial 37S ribosomal protein [Saccharomycopsis crataegensis]|uniref:Small ribosomal subunit protein mS29 n=1 Tax=Saccharomycopsis crataegensis TaxID=43959 RepID=A0AAV5QMH2_9ASCO|nr:mitochondrial 37S ribosomal protein [Saccharomycopsis crataegensis]
MLRHALLRSSQGVARLQAPVVSGASLFHTSSATYSAPMPKFGLARRKTPKGQKGQKKSKVSKGTPGNNDSFMEYVRDKSISLKAPSLASDLENIEEIVQARLTADNKLENKDTLPQLTKYSDDSLKRLHHIGAFQKAQYHELFREKVSLLRQETLKICNKLTESASKSPKIVITGESGIGKSTALAQVQSYLMSKDSIIFHLPNVKTIVDGTYEFNLNSSTNLYDQPGLIKKVFIKLSKSNKELLSSIKLSDNYTYGTARFSPENHSLHDLVMLPAKVPKNLYSSVFNDVVKELQKQDKYSVYLTIDEFNSLVEHSGSAYRDIDYNVIGIDKLSMVKFALDWIKGAIAFPRGGVVLANSSNYQESSTFKFAVGMEPLNPFDETLDKSLVSYLKDVEVVKLEKLSREEIGELTQWQLNNGLIISQDISMSEDGEVDVQKLVNEKYFLSSNGNPREFIKSCNLLYY